MSDAAQLPFEFDVRPSFGGEDFLVTDSNREAVAWIDRWPDWRAPALILYGPTGCGKSHLAEVFRRASGARLVDHDALRADEARDPAAAGGAWIVEDADSYLRAAPPAPLFHLYNQVAEGGGRLLLTGRAAPSAWSTGLNDLSSRLNAAQAVAIGLPDDSLMAALLVKLFADRQLRVGIEVIDYAVKRMERSFAAARDLVADVDALALSERRAITVPLIRRVMERAE